MILVMIKKKKQRTRHGKRIRRKVCVFDKTLMESSMQSGVMPIFRKAMIKTRCRSLCNTKHVALNYHFLYTSAPQKPRRKKQQPKKLAKARTTLRTAHIFRFKYTQYMCMHIGYILCCAVLCALCARSFVRSFAKLYCFPHAVSV